MKKMEGVALTEAVNMDSRILTHLTVFLAVATYDITAAIVALVSYGAACSILVWAYPHTEMGKHTIRRRDD